MVLCKLLQHSSYLWRVVRGGLDPEDDLVLEGVGVLVAGKEHVRVLEQLTADKVAQGVVLLVYGEDGGVGHLGCKINKDVIQKLILRQCGQNSAIQQ